MRPGVNSSGVRAQLDSGNVAYGSGRLEDAREHYRRIVTLDRHVAAGWYGLFMAERALGNGAAADSALNVVNTLSPGAVSVGEGGEQDSPHDRVAPGPVEEEGLPGG